MNTNIRSLIQHVTYISGHEFIPNKEPHVEYYSDFIVYYVYNKDDYNIASIYSLTGLCNKVSPKYIGNISSRILQKHKLLIDNIKSLIDHYCSYYNTSHSGITITKYGTISRIVDVDNNGNIVLLPAFTIKGLVNMVNSDYLYECKLP